MIWDDSRIPFWYRQDVLLFLNKATKSELVESLQRDCRPPLSLIHPELLLCKDRFYIQSYLDADMSASDAFKLFLRRVSKSVQRRIPGKTGVRGSSQ